MWSSVRRHTGLKFGVVFAAVVTGVGVATVAPALANAANPNPDTSVTAMVNADGTVTVKASGTWSWPGQNCAGRYGEGYAVDWWGIGPSPTPANSFSLTNATIVTSPTATTTGTITPDGSIQIHNDGYFHVSSDYNGQTINSASTCTDTTIGGQAGSTGSWSAMATYPSQSDLPPQICVNMYDEHGSEGKASGSTNDFSAINDNDNSIQTNSFNPALGAGFCATPKVVMPPGIKLLKQICKVAAAQCSKSVNADWTSAHEIPSGSTAVWRITVTNSGGQTLTNVTVSDPNAPACAGQYAASLAPGGKVVMTCDSLKVTKGFKNVAKVTGAPPSGASVTATGSATVTVLKPPPGITTSQSLTPNDEGFVNNGQEATGTMTFKLFPPNDPTCSGTPAFKQTVTVNNGIGLTTNTTFIATQPGTWRWLVRYSGDATHNKASSGCGVESFTLKNS
jgi:hypothetical protein